MFQVPVNTRRPAICVFAGSFGAASFAFSISLFSYYWMMPKLHGLRQLCPRTGLRLNDYAMVLQAAVAGEGFAFGWQHVVRSLTDQHLLAGRPDWSWRTGNGIYVVWSKQRPLSKQAAQVRDWIVSMSDYPKSRGAL